MLTPLWAEPVTLSSSTPAPGTNTRLTTSVASPGAVQMNWSSPSAARPFISGASVRTCASLSNTNTLYRSGLRHTSSGVAPSSATASGYPAGSVGIAGSASS